MSRPSRSLQGGAPVADAWAKSIASDCIAVPTIEPP